MGDMEGDQCDVCIWRVAEDDRNVDAKFALGVVQPSGSNADSGRSGTLESGQTEHL